jgi:conjugal transfer ATP-binding protein TraC
MFNPGQIKKQEEMELKANVLAQGEKVKQVEATPYLTRELIEEEKSYRRGALSIKDLIAPASIEVSSNFLKLGSKFVRTIFVINYPRYISVGWFAPIINLNSTFDISMFFYPVESAVVLNQLKKKVGN